MNTMARDGGLLFLIPPPLDRFGENCRIVG